MEQILLAYGLPKETVAAITILYRNTKVNVRSPDGDTEYFDIEAGVLQGDTLTVILIYIYLKKPSSGYYKFISVGSAVNETDFIGETSPVGVNFKKMFVFSMDSSSFKKEN